MSLIESILRVTRRSLTCLVGGLAIAAALAPAISPASPPDLGRPYVYRALDTGFEGEGFAPVGLRLARLGSAPSTARQLTADPGDHDPAVSPDGHWVVFSRFMREDGNSNAGEGLFLVRSDGSGLRRLTDGPSIGGSDFEASFAPSGKRILFVRLEDETIRGTNQGDVYSIRLDGSGLRQITSGREADRSPVVSPNGRQIVFARSPRPPLASIPDIYSIRSDGSNLENLTPRIPAKRRRTERVIAASEPTFSPSGRVIAFAVSASGSEGIDTMRADGSNIRSLVGAGPRRLNRRFGLSEPEFSPTGQTILVTARDSYHSEIALIDLADRSRLYTPHSVQGDSPAW